MNLKKLQQQLAFEEGRPSRTYLDSKGILTGGIGHNLIAHPEPGYDRVGILVPDDVCTRWFTRDISDAGTLLDVHTPWWLNLNDPRQNALLNLVFNMGWGDGLNAGLSTFNRTLALFEAGDYAGAANGFRNSQWARDVKAERTKRVTDMIETGRFWDDVMPSFSDVRSGSSTYSP